MTQALANQASGVPQAFGQRGGGTFQASPSEKQRLAGALSAHFTLVWRSLRRFGVDEAGADDAAQQVFLTLAERLPEIEEGRERAYLMSTAVRVAANTRRRQARRPDAPSDSVEQAESKLDPEQLLASKQRRQVLDQALDALPLDQRTVFVLYELEGFSLPEIAESLDLPLGTATSRLRRARERFESWVNRRNFGGAP